MTFSYFVLQMGSGVHTGFHLQLHAQG